MSDGNFMGTYINPIPVPPPRPPKSRIKSSSKIDDDDSIQRNQLDDVSSNSNGGVHLGIDITGNIAIGESGGFGFNSSGPTLML
jgi:hypothetical protein